MVLLCVAFMFGGTVAEGIGGVRAEHPIHGMLLIFLECMIALSVTLLFGTWFSALSTGVIMPTEGLWCRAAFEMQNPQAGSLQFSPFGNVSVPSAPMIVYAVVYLLVSFGMALFHWADRDL